MPITVAFCVLITTAYYLGFSARCSYNCPLDWRNSDTVRLVLHPIIHVSDQHLVGNLFGIIIIGFLLETWMVPLSRKKHLTIFFLCYLVSTFAVLVTWFVLNDRNVVGASGMLFALLGFVSYYYFTYPDLKLEGGFRHAPLLIGIILASLVFSLFAFIPSTSFQLITAESWNSFVGHWVSFLTAYFVAKYLFRIWKLPRRTHNQT